MTTYGASVCFILLASLSISLASHGHDSGQPRTLKFLNEMKLREKLSHFHFYFHDVLSGKHPTGVTVVNPPLNTSSTFFGYTRVIDNPLTLGPERNSKLIGKAQGLYCSASQDELAVFLSMNIEFLEGKYNGSVITVQGRDPAFRKVREMPVIGGTGLLRFAKGYAEAKTHTFDLKTGDAVIEYNVYVMHY